MIRGSIPNLNETGFGWPVEFIDDFPVVSYPEIPNKVLGEGTYENPYAVELATSKSTKVEFVLWLGPEGPNIANDIDYIFTSDDPELFELFTDTNIDVVDLEFKLKNEKWARTISTIINDLAEFSPKTKSMLADYSEMKLTNALLEFDWLMKKGDGISLGSSQVSGATISFPDYEQVVSGHHASIKSQAMMNDMLQFVNSENQETNIIQDWLISTGSDINNGSSRHCLLLISTEDNAEWSNFINEVESHQNTKHSLTTSVGNAMTYVFSDIESSIQGASQPTSTPNTYSKGVATLKTSSVFVHHGNVFDGAMEQIGFVINDLLNNGFDKLIVIAHSITGKSCMQMIDDGVLDDTMIAGLMTVNSPNNGTLIESASDDVKFVIQLLSTLSADIHQLSPTIPGIESDFRLDVNQLIKLLETSRSVAS